VAIRVCSCIFDSKLSESKPNPMTLPALLFAFLLALLYGALYHLIRNGGFWRLILYFILSVVGFTIGHFMGLWRGWVFIPIGSLNLGMSSLGSLIILIFGDWLSRIESSRESKV
jgi:riboflavin transporter FmnP